MFHKHLHTNSYFFAVNVLIQAGWDSGNEEGVLKNLAMIKTALLTINDNLTF